MYKYCVSFLLLWLGVCLAHEYDHNDGLDSLKFELTNVYGSNEGASLLPHGGDSVGDGPLINARCSPDNSAPCGRPLSKFYNPRFQGSACVRQGCCWNDEKRQCYQRVYNVLKKSSPTMEWCKENGNFYYNNICYFIPDKDSDTYALAQQSCKDAHQEAELAQITSLSVQEALMGFARLSMSGGTKIYRVGGSYDTANDKVSWDGGNTYIASDLIMRWQTGYPNSVNSNTYLFLEVSSDEASNNNDVLNFNDSAFTAPTMPTLCKIR